jgi:hypothetical protein
MKYTKQNIVEGIYNKLDAMFEHEPMLHPMKELYKEKLVHYPKEVEQNVLEWINDLPLTEIDCYGVSIKGVMVDLELPDVWFPRVLSSFIDFMNSGFDDPYVIYGSFV